MNWSIKLDGGALIGKKTEGSDLNIPANGSVSISSKFILGFGPTHVIVEAWIPDGHLDTRRLGGFVYIFFIYVIFIFILIEPRFGIIIFKNPWSYKGYHHLISIFTLRLK